MKFKFRYLWKGDYELSASNKPASNQETNGQFWTQKSDKGPNLRSSKAFSMQDLFSNWKMNHKRISKNRKSKLYITVDLIFKVNFKFGINNLGGRYFGNFMRIWGIQNYITCGMIWNNSFLQIHLNFDTNKFTIASFLAYLKARFFERFISWIRGVDLWLGSVAWISGVNSLFGP